MLYVQYNECLAHVSPGFEDHPSSCSSSSCSSSSPSPLIVYDYARTIIKINVTDTQDYNTPLSPPKITPFYSTLSSPFVAYPARIKMQSQSQAGPSRSRAPSLAMLDGAELIKQGAEAVSLATSDPNVKLIYRGSIACHHSIRHLPPTPPLLLPKQVHQ